MHNILILGTGRSGTSMVAGTLRNAGYFMEENSWDPRNSNPKGSFEDREINSINEQNIGFSGSASAALFGEMVVPGSTLES